MSLKPPAIQVTFVKYVSTNEHNTNSCTAEVPNPLASAGTSGALYNGVVTGASTNASRAIEM